MPAHKGHKKAGGRKKGTPNKTTAAVKAALVEAFGELGGVPALVKWAKANPTEFYKLWGKMLPLEVKTDGVPVTLRVVEEIVDGGADAGAAAPGPAPVPPQ